MNESQLRAAVEALEDKAAGRAFTQEERDQWNDLNSKVDEFDKRRERLRELAGNPRNHEAGASFRSLDGSGVRDEELPAHVRGSREAALRANERAEFLPEKSREHMERELRDDDDPEARLARYTVALADRDYLRAFARWMNDPVSGPHTWSPEERKAVRGVQWLSRSMNLGTGGAGGFLVPYELDPSILIASTGYQDPMRAISRVATTAYNEKRFVTSVGVTSHWYAEEAQVSDDSPALLQPAIICRKAMAWVPVSYELYEDSDIAQQIGNVFADSKSAEEARVFTLGNGTTEPKGVITAISAVGGSVIATGTNTVAVADAYNNQNALPPRWRSNAKFAANLSIINAFRQLPQATGLNYSIVNDDSSPPTMLGWQLRENSNMDGTLTVSAADYGLLSGDFQQYAIVDRVGTNIEFVPVIVGANQRPTGQRGFLMHWRVGADALIPDAFRLTNWSGNGSEETEAARGQTDGHGQARQERVPVVGWGHAGTRLPPACEAVPGVVRAGCRAAAACRSGAGEPESQPPGQPDGPERAWKALSARAAFFLRAP
jgi:HK97 family phage major capsid protein